MSVATVASDVPRNSVLVRFWRSRVLTLCIVGVDVCFFALFWLLAYKLRQALNPWFHAPINPIEHYQHALPKMLVLWVAVTAYYGHYAHRERISSLNELRRIFRASFDMLVCTFALAFIFKGYDLGRSVILFTAVFYFLHLYGSRSALRYVKEGLRQRGYNLTRVLVIGTGDTGASVVAHVKDHPEIGYALIGFVDDDPAKRGTSFNGYPILGTTQDLVRLIREQRVDEVFLAAPDMEQNKMMNLIVSCEEARINFKLVSNLMEVITSKVKMDEIGGLPIISLPNTQIPALHAFLKRAMDLIVAMVLTVLFSPVLVLIALAIKLDSKGPAIFTHRRVGKGGKIFTLLKFRTMRTDTDPYSTAPTDPTDPRITRVGRFLRRTSLDEFPQLLNVLNGDMSMVGPRPEMPFIVDQYEEWQKRRLDVKPGVTGLWQIVGRKNLPLTLNIEYDFYYIKNQSLLLDLTILLKTIPAVIFGKGAY